MAKYIILILILFLPLIACKNKQTQETDLKETVFPIPYDTTFHYKSTIKYYFVPKKSTDPLWVKYLDGTEMSINNALWTNNSIFITAEMKKKYNIDQVHIWAIDSAGETLVSTKIKNLETTYSEYNSFVIPQKNAYPTYFYLQENPSIKPYASDTNKDVDVLIQSLKRYSINRMIWSNSLNDFEYKTVTLDDILKKFAIDNELVYMRSVKLRKIDNYIILYGEANWTYPYLVLLDQNLKVLKAHIYADEKYSNTYIDHIECTSNSHFMLNGNKEDAADGYYYSTKMKLEVDKDLNFLNDYSESEPYYSYYRGPSAPDYLEEDTPSDYTPSDTTIEENNIEEEIEIVPEIKDKNITETILDSTKVSYFTMNYNEDRLGIYFLKKRNPINNDLLFERSFGFPETYLYRKSITTLDGGFVITFEDRDRTSTPNDYDKDSFRSRLILFKFNKEGNLSEQYETEYYYGRIGYVNVLDIENNKIAVVFQLTNPYFDGQDWNYPEKLAVTCFPYRSSFSEENKLQN